MAATLLSSARLLGPALLATVAAATVAAAPAQATVYPISQSGTAPIMGGELSPLSDTVTGSITTNGTIGVLQSSDILSYDLHIVDNVRPAYDIDLTPSNSGIYVNAGGGLSATATALSFDFSKSGANFVIQGTTYGFSSGYQYFCFQATTGVCAAGETIVPDYYAVDGVRVTGLTGTTPLTPPAGGTVPEPATLSLLGVALAGVGVARRRTAA